MKRYSFGKLLESLILVYTVFVVFPGQAAAAPTVRVMPDGIKTPTMHTAYAWAGKQIALWGNVTWDTSTSGTWEWDVDGDGTYDVSGTVTNAKDIAVNHTYTTAGTYFPRLRVTDGDGETQAAQLRLDVLPADDGIASVNLAIQRGLKGLYLKQNAAGAWVESSSYQGLRASTALSVLAFENAGHRPISDSTDIYRDTVQAGLNYLFTQLYYQTSFPNWQNPDSNGNGVILGIYNEEFYPHGMAMMAIAGAGPYNTAFPTTDAVHNPALNLTVPASVPNIGGWRYYDVLQDMVDFAVWAQADPGTWGRGGWRYGPNSGEADNSVGQWPVIGLEAAENWGLYAPTWVKDELRNYWIPASYNSSTGGWGYTDTTYQTVSHAGAGMCLLAYAGVAKTDPMEINTVNALASHWMGDPNYTFEGYYWYPWPSHLTPSNHFYDNYYAMYGVAKGARIARDTSGAVSEITQIGTRNWYDEYAAYLVPLQQSDGSWPATTIWSAEINTPFALLILEPTIASLRPQAAITASPNPVPPATNISYDMSGSTHQDSSKFLVSWKIDFDVDDGVDWAHADAQGAFPATPVVKNGGFPELGYDYDKTATLQVTDNVGDVDEATVVVHITSANVSPIADAGGPYFGSIGAPITLDGSASYDPNPGDTIVSYAWDLDGDGQYNDANGAIIQNTWNTPYTGYVGLRVCDNFGACSVGSAYTNITVSNLKPVSYTLQSYRRISRYVWEYTYQFTLENTGNGDATDVAVSMQTVPAQVQIIDGDVTFGTVAAGQQVTGQDTFTIRIDRRVAVQNNDLWWTLTFTDTGGVAWKLVNFPLF